MTPGNLWQASKKPEYLFLIFALSYGLVFLALIPPLGGADESFHYQRITSIAYLQWLNRPVEVPSGITAFIAAGRDFFDHHTLPPFGYSQGLWQEMAAIPLNPGFLSLMPPNVMTVHHPFCYIPGLLSFVPGAHVGATPLQLLYLARFSGLCLSIFMTFLAIRIMPTHPSLLCGFALLPVITISRSYLNPDSFTNPLAFLFIAVMLQEMAEERPLTNGKLSAVTLLGFMLAQCKGPYFTLLFLACALPETKFRSPAHRLYALLLIIVPGTLASIAWMLMIKQTSFPGITYTTWGGNANPQMQADFILHHPFSFLGIFIRTVCLTPLLPLSVFGAIEDIGPGRYLPSAVTFGTLGCLFCTALAQRESPVCYPLKTRLITAGIIMAALFLTLTLLYVHWSGFEAKEIKGFQGKYLYPLLPLVPIFLRPAKKPLTSLSPSSYIALLGFLGLSGAALTIAYNYY